MLAAQYRKAHDLICTDLPMPEPAPGEALIRVLYGGICGSDMHVYAGKHPTAVFPVVPGHEFVGELVSVNGAMKTGIELGGLVVAQPYTSCGACEACVSGNDNVCVELRLLGAHRNGCFAEYVTVSANKVYSIPDTIDPKLAVLAEPLAVAVHDVRRSGLKVGQRVLIIGGGVIGLFIAMVAELAGGVVTIAEISEFRRAFAEGLGFVTLDPLDPNYAEDAKNAAQGGGFDVVFEVSGSKSGIRSMTDLVKISGTVMIVGMSGEAFPVDTTSLFLKQADMRGVRIHSQASFAAAVDLLMGGNLNDKLVKMVSGIYPIARIGEAYEYMGGHSDFFKLLLKIGKED
ncbi:MAG: alcohol dehydrogenase catalytic domain-containing protein [Clostridiales Family XIII bacterium]|jgi:2-desacetyl-2-hydroxyethyl bacteriochlorophyllide A dehydrogenase|nr:alcohol dehydrogenase catalytic domain-containing protein [Clostridiales Family XIII bacterium]